GGEACRGRRVGDWGAADDSARRRRGRDRRRGLDNGRRLGRAAGGDGRVVGVTAVDSDPVEDARGVGGEGAGGGGGGGGRAPGERNVCGGEGRSPAAARVGGREKLGRDRAGPAEARHGRR